MSWRHSIRSSMFCVRPKKRVALSETEIDEKIAERTAEKKARDFQKSDEIRAWLLEKGIVLEDTRDGVRWKRK